MQNDKSTLAKFSDPAADVRGQVYQQLANNGEAGRFSVKLIEQILNESDEENLEWINSALEAIQKVDTDQQSGLASLLKANLASSEELPTAQAYWAATLLGLTPELSDTSRSMLSDAASLAADPNVRQRAQWALDQAR